MPMITDWLMVGITLAYVIATIAIFKANKKTQETAEAQLNEMRKEFESVNRPLIEVEVVYLNRTVFALRFVNRGRRVAQKVRITLNETFLDSIIDQKFASLLRKQDGKECVIGVGQHYDLFFGDGNYLRQEEKPPAAGSITYMNDGKNYSDDFDIDMQNYMTFFSVDTELEKLRTELSKQNEQIRRIANILNEISEKSIINDGVEEASENDEQ